MVSVGRRIQEAYDYLGKGENLMGLGSVCLALDMTAQRYAGVQQYTRTAYKRFVRDYMWLIAYVGFPNIMPEAVKIPYRHPGVKSDDNGDTGLKEIMLHLVRCSLANYDDSLNKIVWHNSTVLGLELDGRLILSNRAIWGLVAAVIFCPVNKSEQIADRYWFCLADYKMFVTEYWGRLDLARRVVKTYTGIDYTDGFRIGRGSFDA